MVKSNAKMKKFYIIKTIILTLVVSSISLNCLCQNDSIKKNSIDEKIISSASIIDNPTVFKHYKFKDFQDWFFSELKKEECLKECASSPNLEVSFEVTSTGKIINIKVEEKPNSIYENGKLTVGCLIAIESIMKKSSIYWNGGSHEGKPVIVFYSFTIRFNNETTLRNK
jgi:hypothetical protein